MINLFKLPKTRQSSVVWFRDNQLHETIIPTPRDMEQLKNRMVSHRVGFSEIRTVKAVPPKEYEPINVETLHVAGLVYQMSAV